MSSLESGRNKNLFFGTSWPCAHREICAGEILEVLFCEMQAPWSRYLYKNNIHLLQSTLSL